MWNQRGTQGIPAVDGIQIFDNDDQATKHCLCGTKWHTIESSVQGIIIY